MMPASRATLVSSALAKPTRTFGSLSASPLSMIQQASASGSAPAPSPRPEREVDEARPLGRGSAAGGGQTGVQLGAPARDQIAQRGEQDLLLAGEMVVDQARRETGRRRDVADRGAVIAAAGHHLD